MIRDFEARKGRACPAPTERNRVLSIQLEEAMCVKGPWREGVCLDQVLWVRNRSVARKWKVSACQATEGAMPVVPLEGKRCLPVQAREERGLSTTLEWRSVLNVQTLGGISVQPPRERCLSVCPGPWMAMCSLLLSAMSVQGSLPAEPPFSEHFLLEANNK